MPFLKRFRACHDLQHQFVQCGKILRRSETVFQQTGTIPYNRLFYDADRIKDRLQMVYQALVRDKTAETRMDVVYPLYRDAGIRSCEGLRGRRIFKMDSDPRTR